MKTLFLAGLGVAGALALMPETGHAHGGIYRGPPDVVPPGGGGGRGGGPGGPGDVGRGGPSTPGPGGPAAPQPAGPGTGGPAPAAGGARPATGGRGAPLTVDLTTWDIWWEFHKDPYLGLKDAVHAGTPVSGSDEVYIGATRRVDSRDSMAPSDEDRFEVALPALHRAIQSTEQRDIVSSCMVAMAKLGRDHRDFDLRSSFVPQLARADQEIRETAALALGIAAIPDEQTIQLLGDLVADSAAGRAASGARAVHDRTRAFACYGLGLIAHANAGHDVKRRVFAALRVAVDDPGSVDRNVRVAAIHGISLLNLDAGAAPGQALLAEALACLDAYYARPAGVGEQLMQAHVPTAVARLLGRAHPDADLVARYKARYLADLQGRGDARRTSNDIPRSCAMALGQLCPPVDDDDDEGAGVCRELLSAWHDHKDAQTRYFSIMALGQIGGAWARTALLREFDNAGRSLEKPWVAMAMGVQAFAAHERASAAGESYAPDPEFGRALRTALRDGKDPAALGAFAVALGLCRYEAAADDMRALLARSRNQSVLAGYLCIGLALMDHRRATEDIRAIVQSSVRRPELFRQAAIALGRLGDKRVVSDLQQLLLEQEQTLAQRAAVASALGFVGDRRTVRPLCAMLADTSLSDLSRAFAAVALGGVGDKERLPWNSKIGFGANYRAAVETLTDGATGILDIL
ncbi:MAG: HEAT repeat domain-containing protein [Planctomycetota bacterium]